MTRPGALHAVAVAFLAPDGVPATRLSVLFEGLELLFRESERGPFCTEGDRLKSYSKEKSLSFRCLRESARA